MTNEEINLLKNFITWQSLPFTDNLFTHEGDIIKKFDEWLTIIEADKGGINMAEHVEVIIKIPKYYLTHPQDYTCLAECVRRGTIIPEHHGRVIDESEITKCYMPVNQLDVRGIRTDAPTIIEVSNSE